MRIVNDEARSFVARQTETFDIIHSNFIDTWAATAAGAFVLTENALYTLEAWTSFLRHLTPQGVLSVSRTYSDRHRHEAYRLITLARAALTAVGVGKPEDHLLVMTDTPYPTGLYSMVNILVSRRPFLPQEIRDMRDLCRRLGFEILLAPDASFDEHFRVVATATNLPWLEEHFRLRLAPPTDDSPFFFNMLRLKDLLRGAVPFAVRDVNLQAVTTLGVLLVIVCLLTAVCIVLPLCVRSRLSDLCRRESFAALLRGDRLRLHADRNRSHAMAHHLPRSSRLWTVGRPFRPPCLSRCWQPVDRSRAEHEIIGRTG